MANDDMELVRAYATRQSEKAFEALVARYVNLVYSSAVRQVRDPHLAEEITQAVFVILARKAGALGPRTILPSWLHRTACFAATDALKARRRRAQREQEAHMQSLSNEAEDETWQQISPLLDTAIAGLDEKDRHVIVLRYFQGKSLNEIGVAIGTSEEAAKKRVSRALEKLHRYFSRRGISSTTAIIAMAISANSVQAAPVALAKSVTAVAITKGATASTSTLTLMKGTLKIMTYAKLKLAVGTAVALLLAGGAMTVALSDGTTSPTPAANHNPSTASTTSTTTNLTIGAEFLSVPDNRLDTLNVQWQSAGSGGATAVLTREEHTNILNTLKQNSDVAALGRPNIALTPPLPAKPGPGTISVAKIVQLGGTNAQTGVTLKVTASLSDDSTSTTLNLDMEWRELLDASPTQDGSQQIIRTTRATTVATLVLKPSQTIMIRQPVENNGPPGNAGASKSLVIFVTPQISHFAQRLQQIIKAK